MLIPVAALALFGAPDWLVLEHRKSITRAKYEDRKMLFEFERSSTQCASEHRDKGCAWDEKESVRELARSHQHLKMYNATMKFCWYRSIGRP